MIVIFWHVRVQRTREPAGLPLILSPFCAFYAEEPETIGVNKVCFDTEIRGHVAPLHPSRYANKPRGRARN